ncbi:thiamine pyrophosphate-binding protein [Streptomyces sp. NPDC048434]|uniref:thiamine pyrophosphate-binding protein n=1 Tax=Streptomyces sp. NPDC048434 TaxID=3365549 RepID=UPI00371ACC99
MAAQRIPAVQAAVQIMKDEGVDIAFGCPGAALRPLYAAMAEAGGIERLSVRHEETAAFMADGWARTTGRTGVVAVTAGPGAARLITGLYAARQDAVPLVCLTGRETAGPSRRSGPPHQEVHRPPDLVRLAGPVTKRAERIEDPARIPGAFREAFRIAREGRPGPVLIDVPADLATVEIAYDAGRRPGFDIQPPQAGMPHAGTAQAGSAPAGSVRPPVPSDRAGHTGPDALPASRVLAEVTAVFGAPGPPDAASDTYLVSSSASAAATALADAPRRHRLHGRGRPPGWEVPAAIGVRKALDSRGERTAEVVVVIDGHGLPLLADELASAVRYEVPFVLILCSPGHEDHGGYEGHGADDEHVTDHVKLVEAYGCAGRDVVEPAELRSAVEWARKEAVSTRRPVLVEVRAERAVAERARPLAGRLSGGAATDPVHEFAHRA